MMEDRYPAFDNNLMDDATLHEPRRRRLFVWFKELIQIVLIVVVMRVGMDLFLPRYVVDGASMEPSFHTNERVIVDRITMALSGPARGDVVVLASPTAADELLIKRVVGLPGEHVTITDGRVYINGAPLDEPYVVEFCTYPSCEGSWVLDNDEYFVLGDNRMHSLDSHSFGPVEASTVQGIARVRYWPLTQADILQAPEY
ncbi:MAG: signal peptidase I [Chloroflexi bacterium]|nr:signal peptidase I [Chloroflexota bacterium]